MEAFARVRAHRPLELAALLARGTIRSAPTAIFDAVEAQALAERALLLAQELHDRNAEAHIMANRALLSKFEGDWHQMVVLGERAAALARDLNLRDLLAHVLNDTYAAGLMAQGLSNSAICAALFLAPVSVEKHITNIFAKLDLPPADDTNRRVRAVLTYLNQ